MTKTIKKQKLKDCGNSHTYKGIRPPKCNGGQGCDNCREIRNSRLDMLIEMVRKS